MNNPQKGWPLIHRSWLLSIVLSTILVGLGGVRSHAEIWSVTKCIDSALANNTSLKISRNAELIGEHKESEAFANRLPKVTAVGDYRYFTNLPYQLMPTTVFGGPPGQFREAQFGVPHNINGSLQLNLPLYNPQIHGAVNASSVTTDLARLQTHKSEEQVAYEVASVYYNGQILRNQLEFLDGNIANLKQLANNALKLYEQKLTTKTDVNRVSVQLNMLEAQRVALRTKYQQVISALKTLMGVASDQAVEIDPDVFAPVGIEYVPQEILDLKILATREQLFNTELAAIHDARYLPSINIVAMYGTTGFGYDESPNEFLRFYSVGYAGLQVSYPLFDGTVTRYKASAKRLEIENTNMQYEFLRDQIASQLEIARTQLAVARKLMDVHVEQIGLALEVYEKMRVQRENGTAALTDVLLADNTVREAQQNYLTSVVDYLRARLELKRLTGNMSNNN